MSKRIYLKALYNSSRVFCAAFFLLFIFFSTTTINAEDVLVIEREEDEYFLLDKHLDVLIDKKRNYTINEIASESFRVKFDTSTIQDNAQNENIVFWYRFSIKNVLKSDRQTILEFFNFRLDNVQLYIPNSKGGFDQFTSGDNFSAASKYIDHKNLLFFLPNNAKGQTFTCYLRVEWNLIKEVRGPMRIRTEENFMSYALKEYYILGIFYGILLIMMVYNLVLFFYLKIETYIYYFFYILCVAFYSLSWNGIGFQYLWPNDAWFNLYALPVASYLLIIAVSIYAKNFLMTNTHFKKINLVFIIIIMVRTILFLGGITFFPKLLFHFSFDVIPLIIGFLAGVLSFYRGYKPAKYFVLGYTALFIGFLGITLMRLGILEAQIVTVYSLEIGVVVELTLFTFAMADRFKLLKMEREESLKLVIIQLEENEKLKDTLNEELEEKVRIRTKELVEANEKLEEQKVQITQMNILLDKDNRDLQKNITELHSARVFVKGVEMEEFNTLYPNDESCYRFLSNLKWENGFKCKRCENDKFFWGKSPFSHRCTKCGYEESVTSNTIFHNMRIPISKAFYLIFLVFSSNQKISSTELSKALSLRQKTCWNYKKLISERIMEKQMTAKAEKLDGWDSLILD